MDKAKQKARKKKRREDKLRRKILEHRERKFFYDKLVIEWYPTEIVNEKSDI